MAITAAVDNASETSGDLNKEAWDKYNLLRTAVLVEHAAAGTHGVVTATSVATATITALTTFTAAGNLDIGAYTFRCAGLIDDSLTTGRAVFTTTNGQLTDNANFTLSTNTLAVGASGTLDVSAGTLTLAANQISGDKVEGGTIAAITITALTTAGITASANLDIGAYNLRAATLTADGLTATRVIFAGTNGLLSDDADMTFVTDTLTVAKASIGAAGLTVGATTPTAAQWGFVGDLSYGVSIGNVPAFQVVPATDQLNIAEGSAITVVWGTEIFDIGGNFASNAFTAPVTGKYHFDVILKVGSIDTAASWYQIHLITSNRTYKFGITPLLSADFEWTFCFSITADMDASDTAYVALFQSGGTAQADITTESWFSGVLVG